MVDLFTSTTLIAVCAHCLLTSNLYNFSPELLSCPLLNTDGCFKHSVQLPGDAGELFPERQGGGEACKEKQIQVPARWMNWSLPFVGLLSRAGSSSSTGLVIMVNIHFCQTPVQLKLLLVLKEFPLEVKADCAIKLQLETCLGQGYKCDVSTSTSPQCYPLRIQFQGEDKRGRQGGCSNNCKRRRPRLGGNPSSNQTFLIGSISLT